MSQILAMKKYPVLILLMIQWTLFGQYTDMLNSNRPGGSQGAFAVGTGVLQIESGMTFGSEAHSLRYTETGIFNWDYTLRYGFWKESLEFSLTGDFQRNAISYTQGALPSETRANFKNNIIGAKYLVYNPYIKQEADGPNLYSWRQNNRFQWRDFIPAVAIFAGANFDFSDNPLLPYSESTISPRVMIATQNNWIGGFVFVTNIYADRFTTDFPTYGYTLTLTHATNEYFSIFVENQGFKSDFYADQIFRGGVAVLINKDWQIDGSVSLNAKDTPSLFYTRLGMSYRIDRHKKDEYIEEKGRDARRSKKEEKNQIKRAEKKQKKKRRKMKKQKKKSVFFDDSELTFIPVMSHD